MSKDDRLLRAVAFSPPPGRWLAAAGNPGVVYLWDLKPGDEGGVSKPYKLPPKDSLDSGALFALAFSPDGSQLAAATQSGTLLVWDLNFDNPTKSSVQQYGPAEDEQDFNDLKECRPGRGTVSPTQMWSVAFGPEGRQVVGGDSAGVIHIFDLEQEAAAPVHKLAEHRGGISALAFSQDGTWLASASCDRTVRLWRARSVYLANSESAASERILRGHADAVISLGFSVENRYLATGSQDQTIRLWDLERPEDDPALLGGEEEWVRAIAFNPDDTTLAASSADGTIRLWTVRADDLKRHACDLIGRNLTPEEWQKYAGAEPPDEPAC